MDKERQQKIYELLKRGLRLAENGEDVPPEWARELFPPERREYELVYSGKKTQEQILADTMAVPFQEISTFGTNGTDWHNKLILGDNLQAMKTLLQMKEDDKLANADGTPGVRLVYIDPPFGTKQDFRGSQDQKAYQDKIAGAEFLEFIRKRLILMRELLSNDGVIAVHLDNKQVHYVKVIMDEVFGETNFINEIIWHFSNGTLKNASNSFPNQHNTILLYSKSGKYIFNEQRLEIVSDELAKRFGKYADDDGNILYGKVKNIEKSLLSRVVPSFIKKEGREPDDDDIIYSLLAPKLKSVWDIPQVRKPEYPTTKPEQLLKRIISVFSNEGDIVLDAFAGSGTTAIVSEKLRRRWIAIDCGKLSTYTIQKRMLSLHSKIGNSGKSLKARPFTLYNAGLYDFDTLKQLPWDDWRFFALQLFECKDEPHKIHGFQMDGKRQGSSVHVFNHFDKGTVSRETIADLHASIGKTVGDRCFIIAPRGAFLFQEDYIEMDGVRYYALRIPYSYINELHRREFSALSQPNDEMAINETVEAVGFDFIQPPLVELDLVVKRESVSIKIRNFESRARLRGEEKISKHDALSMVMVDFDYKDNVFNLDRAFYASTIKEKKWKIEFSTKEIEGDVMLVFLDIYGNESRMVIEKNRLALKTHRAKSKE